MMPTGHVKYVLTMKGLCPNIPANTPAMPLDEAHFGGFFVSGGRA